MSGDAECAQAMQNWSVESSFPSNNRISMQRIRDLQKVDKLAPPVKLLVSHRLCRDFVLARHVAAVGY